MLGGNVDVIYSFLRSPHGIGAYVLGGVGTYRVTLSSTSGGLTIDDSENKFGWNAGAGATYPMGGLTIFLEARYHSIATTFVAADQLPFVGLVAGVRFGGS
jgi:opacity protein-like surface antigen